MPRNDCLRQSIRCPLFIAPSICTDSSCACAATAPAVTFASDSGSTENSNDMGARFATAAATASGDTPRALVSMLSGGIITWLGRRRQSSERQWKGYLSIHVLGGQGSTCMYIVLIAPAYKVHGFGQRKLITQAGRSYKRVITWCN